MLQGSGMGARKKFVNAVWISIPSTEPPDGVPGFQISPAGPGGGTTPPGNGIAIRLFDAVPRFGVAYTLPATRQSTALDGVQSMTTVSVTV